MNPFRTTLNAGVSSHTISLSSPILTLGSCFADAMGQRLADSKAQALVNPFGVTFNPVSIHKLLHYAITKQPIPSHTFLSRQDIHFNYDFHSAITASSEEHLKVRLEQTLEQTHSFIKKAEWLMITYGTAWAYSRVDNGDVVANCHKQPASLFTKNLLSPDIVTSSFNALYKALKTLNPHIRIILTVSPVRHIKDTLPLNNVSKSVLRLACHTLQQDFSDVDYFPAYELMMDDLRDYRFYKRDMIHPSEEAEDYIWDYFTTSYLDATYRQFLEKWQSVRQALAHRPFHPSTQQHRNFLTDLLRKLRELNLTANVEQEIADVETQLATVSN